MGLLQSGIDEHSRGDTADKDTTRGNDRGNCHERHSAQSVTARTRMHDLRAQQQKNASHKSCQRRSALDACNRHVRLPSVAIGSNVGAQHGAGAQEHLPPVVLTRLHLVTAGVHVRTDRHVRATRSDHPAQQSVQRELEQAYDHAAHNRGPRVGRERQRRR